MGWAIKQLSHACLWYSQTRYRGRPDALSCNSALCNNASGRPRHLGVIVLTILQTDMK